MLSRFFHKHFSDTQGCILLILGALSCLAAIVSFIGVVKIPAFIEDIAIFGDRGINLYLTLAICGSILVAYALAPPSLRGALFIFQVLIVSGAIGSLFSSSHPTVARLVRWGRPQAELRLGSLTLKEKCDISEADASCPHPDIGRIVLPNNNFEAIIQFNAWPEDFKKWLEKTASGDVVCIIWPYIFKDINLPLSVSIHKPLSKSLPPIAHYQRAYAGQRFWLDPQAAQVLLRTRKLTVQPNFTGSNQETFLAFRDYHIRATSRSDVYIYNGKAYTLPYDGIFPIMLMFESREGIPLALFL